jgi:ankyrin repeat protein
MSLTIAIKKQNIQKINEYMKNHVNINLEDCNNEIIQFKKNNDSYNLTKHYEITPLCVASNIKRSDIIELLLNYTNDCDITYDDDNEQCYYHHNTFNYRNESPLIIAIKNKYYEIAKRFIINGLYINNVDKNNNTPLHIASINNQIEIVELLLDKYANINYCDKYNHSSIYYAINNNNYEIVELLLEYGAKINIINDNDLSQIINKKKYKKIFELIKQYE